MFCCRQMGINKAKIQPSSSCMIRRVVALSSCRSCRRLPERPRISASSAARPRWKVLEKYQETITHDEFAQLIQNVYCTHGFADDLIKIDNDSARILKNREAQSFFTLRFAKDETSRRPRSRVSGVRQNLCRRQNKRNRWPVCASRSIRVISAGNGRKWRSAGFQVGDSSPVTEGDLTLRVARLLAPQLKKLGAKVFLFATAPSP